MIRRFDRFYEKHPRIAATLMFVALAVAVCVMASLDDSSPSTPTHEFTTATHRVV